MNTYKDKYIKYKKKYIELRYGGTDVKNEDNTNLFIFISNTYEDELTSISKNRKDVIKALKFKEDKYDNMFTNNKMKDYEISSNNFNSRFITLNNMSKTKLILNISKINKKYKNINNIILCISGHGLFSPGLVRFLCNDETYIELHEIINLINFKSITILTDVCRLLEDNTTYTDEYKDNESYTKLLKIIENKTVIIMTSSWKGESADGGTLIEALATSIKNNYELFIKSLKTFSIMFVLINDIIKNNVEIVIKKHVVKSWIKYTFLKKKTFSCDREYLCKKLMSVYFNEDAIKLLTNVNKYGQLKNILKKIKYSFKLLCRDFDREDHILEKSLKRQFASIVRK